VTSATSGGGGSTRPESRPSSHRTAAEALERYLAYFGSITKGDVPIDVLMPMLEDLATLFEQAGTPVRAIVGAPPVEFAETFFRKYSDGRWISKEQDQSISAIERGFYKEVEREIAKERGRLVKAVEHAEAEETRG
jgi:hypothetical protein